MKLFTHTLFFLFLITQLCFTQWYQQNSGTTKNLHAVHFIDANNGWAVGDSGTILKTTNLGNNWILQTSGTTLNLCDIQFIDANIGWVVGGSPDSLGLPIPIILKTTNGGTSWFQQMSDTTFYPRAVFFIDANIGWVVGGSYDSQGRDIPNILKTTNGGINWTSKSVPTTISLNDVQFINTAIGFLTAGHDEFTSSGGILKTTDGGDTWINQLVDSTVFYSALSFFDELNGIVTGHSHPSLMFYTGLIFRTTDGGINWEPSFSSIFTRITGVTSAGLGYTWAIEEPAVTPGLSRILYSSDKGVNWSEQVAFQSDSMWLESIFCIDSITGWAIGYKGAIFHTTNGGVSFVEEEQINELPIEFLLSQNYPNPFNPITKLKYSIPQSLQVLIKVFDALGNEIETLVNEEKSIGTYEFTWNATILPSGVYFYQLKAGSFVETKKMILLK